MKAPALYEVGSDFLNDVITGGSPQAEVDGRWVPARPIGFYSWRRRLRYAWGVFTGRYDALEWPGQ